MVSIKIHPQGLACPDGTIQDPTTQFTCSFCPAEENDNRWLMGIASAPWHALTSGVLAALLALTALLSPAALAAPLAAGKSSMSSLCKNTPLIIERNTSPWRDYTGDAREEQAGYHIAAVESLTGMTVLPSLAQYTFRDRPMLAIDTKRRRVVVHAIVFSDLQRPDATQLKPAESALIGTMRHAEAFADLRTLAEFLLRAQIVRTYAHVQAELCRVSEQHEPDVYRADYAGMHEYYTNKRHRIHFGFSIVIHRKSGEMRVVGRTSPQK